MVTDLLIAIVVLCGVIIALVAGFSAKLSGAQANNILTQAGVAFAGSVGVLLALLNAAKVI
ncbi:hypothetical protein [Actinomadura violacea]|uniref:Uncharacterized protein n=1 Tax=Actinomadura violacea TaxID=2819934 RepID=A0ABS3RSU2_9ACTN|nr:hypothetical protein [Actinomadura violacea]MBO2459836.1 hypothetical protein [Actinomadura violacea]